MRFGFMRFGGDCFLRRLARGRFVFFVFRKLGFDAFDAGESGGEGGVGRGERGLEIGDGGAGAFAGAGFDVGEEVAVEGAFGGHGACWVCVVVFVGFAGGGSV